jgi:hypothetical protein
MKCLFRPGDRESARVMEAAATRFQKPAPVAPKPSGRRRPGRRRTRSTPPSQLRIGGMTPERWDRLEALAAERGLSFTDNGLQGVDLILAAPRLLGQPVPTPER